MNLENHLRRLEELLHKKDVRADKKKLTELFAEDFFEFGVSGTVWTRRTVIEALRHEKFSEREISDFKLTLLAEDAALVTCRGHRFANDSRPAADSLRSPIWKRREERWHMVFHQGTFLL